MVIRRIWPALLAIAMLLPLAAPAVARPRLTLRVRSVGRAPSSLRRGGSFTVAYKVARAGSGLKRATLGFYLSRTAKKTHALHLAGGPSLKGLVRKRTVKGKAHLKVPASASGRYRLLACVEKVKARGKPKVGAPCHAAAGTITVAVAGGSQPAPAPAPVSHPAPGGGPSPTPTPTPSPTPTPGPAIDPASPLATADPLAVSPALDSAHAADGTIGASGGTLNATGADGTAYELSVPAGALVSDQDISMTPLSSIGDLPFDSLVGAVDLQPDGLQLLKPVRLTITPSGTAPDLAHQSFFAYEGDGKDFHDYPPVNDDSVLAIDLTHFTGGGVASGTAAERADVASHTPAEYAAQYEAKAAADARALRDGSMTFEEYVTASTTLGRAYYTHVIKPRLQAATKDDSLIELATTTYSAWEQSIEFLGLGPDFEAENKEAQDLLRAGLKNAFNKTYDRCLAHDVGQVKRFVAVARFATLLGEDIGQDDITTKLSNCLHFRLDLILHLERTGTQSHDHVLMDASSTAQPIPFDINTAQPKGDLPWHVDKWNWDERICFKAGGDATPIAPAKATLSIDVNLVVKHLPSGATTYTSDPPKLKLTLDPGNINTRSQCAVDADPGNPTGNGGSAAGWFKSTMHAQYGTFETQFLDPFTAWSYQGPQEFPWATLLAPATAPYDGQLQMILTHDPAHS